MSVLGKSTFIDPDSWLAGVLDACGAFNLWESRGGRWSWRVALTMNENAATQFERLSRAKLRRIGVCRYTVTATDALPLLSRVMPYMITLHEEAGVVYRYLLTRPGKQGMRGAMTKAVAKYRKEMVTRLRVVKGAR